MTSTERPSPEVRWARPLPLIGDDTSAAQRSSDPTGWRLSDDARAGLYETIDRRRDVRRFRSDPVPEEILQRLLGAAHAAPSVGHSQPWRFLIVTDSGIRDRAALIADRERLLQADELNEESGRALLDLQLEGIREAPHGIVVCCDRRAPAAGVLGRRTFPDADLWSCACAIENLWLAARAEGLGVGWVTLFPPAELAELCKLPADVIPLGWLCVGWPDERPPDPGLERAGWSKRQPVEEVVFRDQWPTGVDSPKPPPSRLRAPAQEAVVAAHDSGDALLTPPGSLGVLDRAVDRVLALGHHNLSGGTLLLVAGRHRVTELGVSAFAASVTDDVLAAARAGQALGVVSAVGAGLHCEVVDAGTSTGDLLHADALSDCAVELLVEQGVSAGRAAGAEGLVAIGEVGVGNTTVAAALTASLLGLDGSDVVGRGASSDSAIVERKQEVIDGALRRVDNGADALRTLAALGGPEFAFLAGVTLGAAEAGAPIVLDGLATSVAALLAVRIEPGVSANLIAGQRSREPAHSRVLTELGLEPLLDLRIRSGEGVGACLAANLLLQALRLRSLTARTE